MLGDLGGFGQMADSLHLARASATLYHLSWGALILGKLRQVNQLAAATV
jgi:hypothetical protein